jgi:hypothetical protein
MSVRRLSTVSSRVPGPQFADRSASAGSDPSRNRPLRWTQRYELVLRLYLAGRRTTEIAEELRYSPHRVSMIINSPLFEERKATLVRELRGEIHSGVLRDIEADAMRNFETLQELRDNETVPVRIRLRAAQTIAQQLDRVLPRGGRE